MGMNDWLSEDARRLLEAHGYADAPQTAPRPQTPRDDVSLRDLEQMFTGRVGAPEEEENFAFRPGAWFQHQLQEPRPIIPELREKHPWLDALLKPADVFFAGVQTPWQAYVRPFLGTGAMEPEELSRIFEEKGATLEGIKEAGQRGYEAFEDYPLWFQIGSSIITDPMILAEGISPVKALRESRQLARFTKPLSELSWLERKAIGAPKVAEGAVATAEELGMGTAKGSKLSRILKWPFTPTRESKATMAASNARDLIMPRIQAANTADEVLDTVRAIADPERLPEIGKGVTMGGRTMQSGMSQAGQTAHHLLQGADEPVESLVRLYKSPEAQATWGQINEIAERMKVPANDVISAIHHDAGAVAKQVGLDEKVVSALGKMAREVPRDMDHLKALTDATITEHMAERAAQMYGVQAKKVIPRAHAVLKAIQSVPFLGLNPAYLVNNTMNNLATMVTYGVVDLKGSRVINRLGLTPTRFKQGIAPAGEALGDVLKGGEDAMAPITKAIGKRMGTQKTGLERGVQKVGGWMPFTRLSQWVERQCSESAFGAGISKYWNRFWPQMIRQMPDDLIADLGPDVADDVLRKVRAGMNADEIKQAIYAGKRSPDYHIQRALERGLIDEKDIQLFNQAGDIGDRLAKAKDPITEIRKIVGEVSERSRKLADEVLSQDNLADKLKAGGPSAIVDTLLRGDMDRSNVFARASRVMSEMQGSEYARLLREQYFDALHLREHQRYEIITDFLRKNHPEIKVPSLESLQQLLKQTWAATSETSDAKKIDQLWNVYKDALDTFDDEFMDAILKGMGLKGGKASQLADNFMKARAEARVADRRILQDGVNKVRAAEEMGQKPGPIWAQVEAMRRDLRTSVNAGLRQLADDLYREIGFGPRGVGPEVVSAIDPIQDFRVAAGQLNQKHALNSVNKALREAGLPEVKKLSDVEKLPVEQIDLITQGLKRSGAKGAREAASHTDFSDGVPDLVDINDEATGSLLKTLRAIEDGILSDPGEVLGVPDKAKARLDKWLKEVIEEDLPEAKVAAIKMGEWMRDQVLLNYSMRYGYNDALSYLLPYEFWSTTSLRNWALKLIERPDLAAMYARTRRMLYDKTDEPGFPSRLKGKVKIEMPWLDKFGFGWAGDVYFDPLTVTGLPLENFTYGLQALEYATDKANLQKKLDDALARGAPPDEIAEIRTALKEAHGHDVMDYSSILSSPGLYLTVPWALMSGGIKGKDMPTIFPGNPLVRALTGVDPEGALRTGINELLGTEMPPGGEWETYLVERMVSNMVAMGEAEPEEGERAIIEHTGPIWEEAQRRAELERLPGLLFSPSRGRFYPEGEKFQRAIAGSRSRMYDQRTEMVIRNMLEAGDITEKEARQAISTHSGPVWDKAKGQKLEYGQPGYEEWRAIESKWYEQHPQARSRSMIFEGDTPGVRYREYLQNKLWQLSDLERKALERQFPEEMEALYDKVATAEQVAKLAEAVGIPLPTLPEEPWNAPTPPGFEGGKPTFEPGEEVKVSQEDAKAYADYLDERNRRFPNIFPVQEKYYEIKDTQGSAAARAYKAQHPELQAYWDFMHAFQAAHPGVTKIIWPDKVNQQTATLTLELLRAAQNYRRW